MKSVIPSASVSKKLQLLVGLVHCSISTESGTQSESVSTEVLTIKLSKFVVDILRFGSFAVI